MYTILGLKLMSNKFTLKMCIVSMYCEPEKLRGRECTYTQLEYKTTFECIDKTLTAI